MFFHHRSFTFIVILSIDLVLSIPCRSQTVVVHYSTNDCTKSMHYLEYLVGRLDDEASVYVIVDREKRDFVSALFAEQAFIREHGVEIIYTLPCPGGGPDESWVEVGSPDSLIAEGPITEADRLLDAIASWKAVERGRNTQLDVFSDRVELYAGDGSICAVDYVLNRATLQQERNGALITTARITPRASWGRLLLSRHGLDTTTYDKLRTKVRAFGLETPEITSASFVDGHWRYCLSMSFPRTGGPNEIAFVPLQFLVDLDENGEIVHSIYLNWLPEEAGGTGRRSMGGGWAQDDGGLVLPMSSSDTLGPGCLALHCTIAHDSIRFAQNTGCTVPDTVLARVRHTEIYASNDILLARSVLLFYDVQRRTGIHVQLPPAADAVGRKTWSYGIRRTAKGWTLLFWDGAHSRVAMIDQHHKLEHVRTVSDDRPYHCLVPVSEHYAVGFEVITKKPVLVSIEALMGDDRRHKSAHP